MRKKLEIAANVAIILVAVLLGYVLLDRYVFNRPSAERPTIAAGETLPLTEVDWQRNGRTLVLVLQKGCHYCTESAPFYQRLARQAEQSGKVHLIAVLPQARKEATDYLGGIGVTISDIREAKLGTIKVRGTPTLLLVSNTGVVQKAWIGKLRAEGESEVLRSF
jgi:hypothetical protein